MGRFLAGALAAALATMGGACDEGRGGDEETDRSARWAGYALVGTFGGTGDAPGQLRTPLGVDVDADGRVWVADTGNGRLQVFDATGEPRVVAEGWKRPADVAVAPDGKVWVADLGSDEVRCLKPDGAACRRGSIRLEAPAGIGTREEATPLAAQLYGHRVVSIGGGLSISVGGRGDGSGELLYPTDVAARPDGGFLVADSYNGRVHRFDPRGRAEGAWTGPPGAPFRTPTGVALGDGVIHVADSGTRRVVALSTSGRVLAQWKLEDDREPRIHSPVRVAAHGDRVYVADPANDRIVVLRRR